MKSLYGKLAELGFPKAFVREKVLPSWWEDEAGNSPAGFAEAALMVSRLLGVDLASLQDEGATARLRAPATTKYKLPKSHDEGSVALSRSVAEQVARLAALGASGTQPCSIGPAADVRAAILERGAPAVTLEALVDFTWDCGIPVIYIDGIPSKLPKMQGMAAKVGDRPVIVVSKKGRPAWLLFIVAHELGHIACGHVERDSFLFDEAIEQDSDDSEEKVANAYAKTLLLGPQIGGFTASGRWPNARSLASQAIQDGRRFRVDAGHIALNYAHNMGKTFYGVGQAALKLIEGDRDGGTIIAQKMAERLDWSAIPEAGSEFLARMTGASVDGLS